MGGLGTRTPIDRSVNERHFCQIRQTEILLVNRLLTDRKTCRNYALYPASTAMVQFSVRRSGDLPLDLSKALPHQREPGQHGRKRLPRSDRPPGRTLPPEDRGGNETQERHGEKCAVLLPRRKHVVDADADDGDGEAVEGRQGRLVEPFGCQRSFRGEEVADAVVEGAGAEEVDGESGEAWHCVCVCVYVYEESYVSGTAHDL